MLHNYCAKRLLEPHQPLLYSCRNDQVQPTNQNDCIPFQTTILTMMSPLEDPPAFQRRRRGLLLLFLGLSGCAPFGVADYNVNPHQPPSSQRTSIPRSAHSSHYQRLRQAATSYDQDVDPSYDDSSTLVLERSPWKPSPHIDASGFLVDDYGRIPGDWEREFKLGGRYQHTHSLTTVKVRIRDVPGDGNCLFHSISTCMAYVGNGAHVDFSTHAGLKWLYQHSAQLRQQAVECLRKRKVLFVQGKEYLGVHDLVEAAAAQYGISAEQYCDLMQQDSYWGGGPEIVALCNVLKRPIHVYELAETTKTSGFVLRRMACFGSPKFDGKPPFHILSADSRFPDISPGKQLPGDHFLAVFPLD